eukprot:jgi/Botrbrau1/10997/Bobra.0234s0020.1
MHYERSSPLRARPGKAAGVTIKAERISQRATDPDLPLQQILRREPTPSICIPAQARASHTLANWTCQASTVARRCIRRVPRLPHGSLLPRVPRLVELTSLLPQAPTAAGRSSTWWRPQQRCHGGLMLWDCTAGSSAFSCTSSARVDGNAPRRDSVTPPTQEGGVQGASTLRDLVDSPRKPDLQLAKQDSMTACGPKKSFVSLTALMSESSQTERMLNHDGRPAENQHPGFESGSGPQPDQISGDHVISGHGDGGPRQVPGQATSSSARGSSAVSLDILEASAATGTSRGGNPTCELVKGDRQNGNEAAPQWLLGGEPLILVTRELPRIRTKPGMQKSPPERVNRNSLKEAPASPRWWAACTGCTPCVRA